MLTRYKNKAKKFGKALSLLGKAGVSIIKEPFTNERYKKQMEQFDKKMLLEDEVLKEKIANRKRY